jgi:hypothetical protein
VQGLGKGAAASKETQAAKGGQEMEIETATVSSHLLFLFFMDVLTWKLHLGSNKKWALPIAIFTP